VLTFFGYSGAGYEDEDSMLEIARQTLERFSPQQALLNIGGTEEGVGKVYELAKQMGFITTGVVSTEALSYPGGLSGFVDYVCFVKDTVWGGYLNGGQALSPTSEAMVAVSDYCVAIGGGAISRDELLEAKRRNMPVIFFPADVNHDFLRRKAKASGQDTPLFYKGDAHETFMGRSKPNE
jgi:hypothetical protein